MKTAKVTYQGDLRTSCEHIRSEKKVMTDAPVDNHGKGEAFSPTDLLSTALVSCMLTTMGIVAQKNGILFQGAEADLEKIMADEPRRVAEIIIRIKMPKLDYSDRQKQILERAAIECPVAKSLHPDIRQTVQFDY